MKTPNAFYVKQETYLKIKTLRKLSEGFINVARIADIAPKNDKLKNGMIGRNGQGEFTFQDAAAMLNICGNWLSGTLNNSANFISSLGEKEAYKGIGEILAEYLRPISVKINNRPQKYPREKNILESATEIANHFYIEDTKKMLNSIESLKIAIKDTKNLEKTDHEYKELPELFNDIFGNITPEEKTLVAVSPYTAEMPKTAKLQTLT